MRGSVRKRGNTWSIIVDIGIGDDGKRRQKWHSGYRTRKDADAALPKILASLDQGSYIEPNKETVADFLTEWLPAIKTTIRPGTWRSYEMNVRTHAMPRIGRVPLRKLGPSHLNSMYADLLDHGRANERGGLSPRTVRYTHTILRRALRDAVRWGRLSRNPADLADPPRSRPPQIKVWTPEQLRSFLATVESDPLAAAWVLLATTGLRRGELLALRWEDVDFGRGRIAIRQTLGSHGGKLVFADPKTNSSRRSILLDPQTVDLLKHHLERQDAERASADQAYADQGLVFCREDGTPIRPDTLSRAFTAHSAAAGLPVIRLHDLRHTNATIALAAGVHPKVVAERLGHANIGVTLNTYSHVLPTIEAQAATTIASVILRESQADVL